MRLLQHGCVINYTNFTCEREEAHTQKLCMKEASEATHDLLRPAYRANIQRGLDTAPDTKVSMTTYHSSPPKTLTGMLVHRRVSRFVRKET